MSRSYKKAIVKVGRWMKPSYWKTIRARHKTEINSGVHPEDVSNPKTIVNDYDHCDYIFSCEYSKDCYCIREYGFKKCANK